MPLENLNRRRNSRNTSSGSNCVELPDIAGVVTWRRSSYSGPNGGNCIELAQTAGASVVAVRDSKNRDGPVLLVTRAALRTAVQSAAGTH